MKVWRPPNLRRAPTSARRCHTCLYMGRRTGVCWRYLYTVRRNQLCDRWRAD